MSTITTSAFSRTPQAQDDAFASGATEGFLESGGYITLDVIANDLGGAAKTLYSVGSGVGSTTEIMQELVIPDLTNGACLDGYTALGATLRILDGKVQISIGTSDSYAAAITALAKGQVLEDSFVYAIRLGNGTLSWAKVTFNITGSNDGPVVAVADVTGTVAELVTAEGDLTESGTIAFTDVDLTDSHSVSAVVPSTGALGSLTASVTADTTGTGTGGVLTWNYSVAASAVEYLAAGQTKLETFTFSLNDGNGGSVERTVSVTITGTNDEPVVALADVTGSVTELVTAVGNLTDSGTITFADVDLTDAHSVSAVVPSSGALGALTASVTADTTGTGSGGVLTWNYSVAASAVEFLAAGQTKLETFTFSLSDGNGGSVERTVSVTITGTNDEPVVALADVTGTITELVTPIGNLTDSGTIAFTDVDLTDSHSVGSVVPSTGALGALTASVTADTTGSGSGGVLTWNYSVAASAVEFLAAGQTQVESFTFSLSDGNGGIVQRTVSVTLTGTNDAPAVAVTDVTGSVTELVTAEGNLTDSGTITFTDVDLTDSHSVSAVVPSTGALGALTASVTADTTGTGTGGVLTWNYSVAASAVEYLAAGQTQVESFTFSLSDGNGGIVPRTVSVTITGTNDEPVVEVGDVTGSVTELGAAVGNLTDSGTISFTDVDLTDLHSVSAVVPSANALGALTASVTADSTGTGSGGVLTWNYSVAASAVEYLAAGQTKLETFTFSLSDGNGGSVERTVSVTITGTNDEPVVALADVTGSVTELVTAVGNLTDSGTITFADVDLTDAHTVSAVVPSTGALGALTASVTADTTGSGSGGVVTWNYSVAASAVEYLAAGQTKSESFTFAVSDGNGGSVERTVSVTITGTNDEPVVALADVTGSVTELVTAVGNLTDSGTITFADVDLTDAHSVSTVVPSANALGALTASVTADTTGSGSGGVVTWNYSVAASAVEYLAAGQTKSESFTFAVSDGNGGSVERTVSVTITGTNDEPVVALADVTGSVTELVTAVGNLTDSGTITFTDVDLTDSHSVSAVVPSTGALGALTASVTADTTGSGSGGVLSWNYSVAASAVEFLAAGRTKVETFTFSLSDGQGSIVPRTVSVTLTGTNDAPVVAVTDVTGTVTELGTATGNLTDSGTISFTDVDLTDSHSVSAVVPSTNALGALTAEVAADTTGTGSGGVLTWNYSVAASAVEFLAAGQTQVESFTFSLSDGNGGIVPRIVSVTLTGTNDAPVVAVADVTGSVTELGTAEGNLTDSGTITFTDVDLTDSHSVSAVVPSTGALGALTASVTADTTGSGSGGVVTWNYSVAASAVEFLAAGQTKVETFTFSLSDGQGSSVERTVSVTITGTADGPAAIGDVVITNVSSGTSFVVPEWALLANDGVGATDVSSVGGAVGLTAVHTAGTSSNGFVTLNDPAPAGGSFTYQATDGTSAGASATVNVNQDIEGDLDGTTNAEIIVSANGGATLRGNAGNDILLGGGGNDTYNFGLDDGTDLIRDSGGGSDKIDIVTAGPGDTTILSTLGFERVGTDLVINVGSTQITVDDHYVSGFQVESIQFSPGGTVYGYALSGNAYRLSTDSSSPLNEGGTSDVIASSSGAETLSGGQGNDLLFGNGGADTINGDAGNDLLVGGAGADTLTGGAGSDTLTGGGDADVLVGGADNDTFVFATGDSSPSVGGSGNAGTISGFDIIRDYSVIAGGAATDRIDTVGNPDVVANTPAGGTNGADSSLTIGGQTVKSHSISNGMITFDDANAFSSALAITSTQHVAAVVQYLQLQDLGNAGATVAFTATIGGDAHTYLFTQGADNGANGSDVVIDLFGVTATGVTETASAASNGYVFIS